MRYFLCLRSNDTFLIDYSARDESAGIIGSVENLPEPLASAETKEELTEIAYAHLGRHPADSLWLVDSENRLHDIIFNRTYEEESSAYIGSLCMAWTCFLLAAVALLLTIVFDLGYLGLILLATFVALYVAMVRGKVFNEVEGAVVCSIGLIFTILLISAIADFREALQQNSEPSPKEPTANQVRESA